jgi:hypothetical protein
LGDMSFLIGPDCLSPQVNVVGINHRDFLC